MPSKQFAPPLPDVVSERGPRVVHYYAGGTWKASAFDGTDR